VINEYLIMEVGGMIQRKPTVLGGHCHLVHHKSHVDQNQISSVIGRPITA
jgi:hypothetical protein